MIKQLNFISLVLFHLWQCSFAFATDISLTHYGSSSTIGNKVSISQKWNQKNRSNLQVKSSQSKTDTTYDSKSSYFKMGHRYKFDNSDSINALLKTSDEVYNFKSLQTGFEHTLNFENLFSTNSVDELLTSFQWGVQIEKFEHSPTKENLLVNEFSLGFQQDINQNFAFYLEYYRNTFQSKSTLASQALSKITTIDSDINSTVDGLYLQGYSLGVEYFADTFDTSFTFSQDQSYVTNAYYNTIDLQFNYTGLESFNYLLGISFSNQPSTNTQTNSFQIGISYYTD